MKADLQVHIDELVATGMSHRDAERLGPAIERRLASLCSEHGMPEPGGPRRIDRVDAGAVSTRGDRGEPIAARVAQQLYMALSGGGK